MTMIRKNTSEALRTQCIQPQSVNPLRRIIAGGILQIGLLFCGCDELPEEGEADGPVESTESSSTERHVQEKSTQTTDLKPELNIQWKKADLAREFRGLPEQGIKLAYFVGCEFENVGIAEDVKLSVKKIDEVHISMSAVSSSVLRFFDANADLKNLLLADCRLDQDAGKALSSFDNLEHLTLSYCKLPKGVLSELLENPNINILGLRYSEFDVRELAAVEHAIMLEQIDLSGIPLKLEDLTVLQNAKGLRIIYMSDTGIETSGEIASIAKTLPQVRVLRVAPEVGAKLSKDFHVTGNDHIDLQKGKVGAKGPPQ